MAKPNFQSLKADNQGAIALTKDNKFHLWTKHIDLRYHFICETVENGKVKMEYIPSADNITNIFMKPLAEPKFKCFVELLGLVMMKESGCYVLNVCKNNRCLIGTGHMMYVYMYT